MKKLKHIDSPSLSVVAYHYLSILPRRDIAELELQEQEIFNTDAALRKWCFEATIDQLLNILGRCGFSWTFRIERNPGITDRLENLCEGQEIYKQKKADITEAAAREGTIIISSKEVMYRSHLLAADLRTRYFKLNPYIIGLMEKEDKMYDVFTQGAKTAKKFAKLVLEQLNSFEYCENILNLTQNEIRVLLCLLLENSYTRSAQEIIDMAKFNEQRLYMKRTIEDLSLKKLIIENAPKYEYGKARSRPSEEARGNDMYLMLTAKGIDKIMNYMKFLHSKVFTSEN